MVSVAPGHAATPPEIKGATRDDNNEFIAFRDDNSSHTGDGFDLTLWVQNVTQCRKNPDECGNKGKGLESDSYSVAYCLHKDYEMPYNLKEHYGKDMTYDEPTGMWTGAQKYWRFTPSDKLIKDSVLRNKGQDANLRAIKKVLYHGFHNADDSKWQTENKITDDEFREATQYALWYYTDGMSTEGFSWPNKNVKIAYDYLLDLGNKLPDAPIDYKVNYFHTDELKGGNKYQDLVSVFNASTNENKPEPKKAKITFKKIDETTNQPLDGVSIRVYAKSKADNDGTILFDKVYDVTPEGVTVDLEQANTYYIEEKTVPAGYTKRTFTVEVDAQGKVTATSDPVGKVDVAPGEGLSIVTLKNGTTNTPIALRTTARVSGEDATADKEAVVYLDDEELHSPLSPTDQVQYSGLDPQKKYKIVTVLNEVAADGAVSPITAVVHEAFTPQEKDGSGSYYAVTPQQNAEYSKSYVFYEYLYLADQDVKLTADNKDVTDESKKLALASHTDPKDKQQTYRFEKMKPVSVNLVAKKIIAGRNFAANDKFKFVLSAQTEYAPMPENGKESIIVTNGDPVTFENLVFTKPTEVIYQIAEVVDDDAPQVADLTYSEPVTIHVAVTLNKETGELVAKVTYPDSQNLANITNTFKPVPLAGSLKTTVDVGGKRASVDAPVEVDASAAVDVVDHVDFAGLAA
ncbi:Cys-Gln thioester bond-forming surface protein, partial [Trueperella sp. LYQ143]|uniref:Cys-Gln thioester bond-forming surface protein n=1 Tax=Trueperella sp. LYQ143 TaxID=3391059 RepID=UPI003982D97E